MMKSFRYIALVWGVSALTLVSCSDSFLDKTPDERTEIDTEDKVVQLLSGSYPDADFAWLGEISSDNLQDNQSPHYPSSPNDKQVLAHYNYSYYSHFDVQLYQMEEASWATYNDDDSPGMIWNVYYKSIASANAALQAIDNIVAKNGGVMSDKLKSARAEALLLRAYDHFVLVNLFSQAYKDSVTSKKDIGVPYMTEVENVVSKDYDRGTVAEDYKKIQEDLEEGLENITDANYTVPKWHFNVNAAHAFAARFYLFSHQWQKAIDQADQVLGTDSASLQSMMLDYSSFANCTSYSEYANKWQDPDANNNIMLAATYSLLERRTFGYRFSVSGDKARSVMMVHTSPLWSGYICPAFEIVSYGLLSNSSHDYGFTTAKIGEQFEYTDKVAGIGYAHIIQRVFTANDLLLERAEARVMLKEYDAAAKDLMAYWNYSINSFSTSDKATYVSTGYIKYLTKATLLNYYSDSTHYNCFSDWDFAKNMSLDIPAEAVPYMNCVNDFRRYENNFEGLRFFDLKRWGIDYTHYVGVNSDEYHIPWNDTRRALEVPWEALSAGMESSRTSDTQSSSAKPSMDIEALKTKQ